MSAKFMFDDYIRCMSAKQRLHRRRTSLRHIKLQRIAQLLELPVFGASPQHFYNIAPSSYMQVGTASPQGFRSRPGGAVAVSSPVRHVSSHLTTEESNHVPYEPAGKETTEKEKPSRQSDPGDYHRMAAPDSYLYPSQASGEQARALASVLEDKSDSPTRSDKLDALVISEQWRDEGTDEVVEEASDVLDTETWNNFVSDDTAGAKGILGTKCPSAPATPRGQRRFGNSTFHVSEWTFGDLTCRNALSEPSLHLEQNNVLEDDSSGSEQQNKDKTEKVGKARSPKRSPKKM